MKVVTISGKAGSGKDTAAKIMKEQLSQRGFNVLITHYADVLKFICTSFFGWNGKKDEDGRKMLQYVGTDVIREQDPEFFTRFLADVLKFFDGEWDVVLIPDTRFPNEISYMREAGFDCTHISIVRPSLQSSLTEEAQHHISETALDDVVPDICLANVGTLDDLSSVIHGMIQAGLNARRITGFDAMRQNQTYAEG